MDKHGVILLGGAYFNDERLKFFDNPIHESYKNNFLVQNVKWEDVENCVKLNIPESDFIFIFGLKTWVRKLHKKRYNSKNIIQMIRNFLSANISNKIPLGVMDDFNLGDEQSMGDSFREMFFRDFNCKVFLLREYLTNKEYDKCVLPFSICCWDYTEMEKSPLEKKYDLYFRGNDSSDDRKPILKEIDEKWEGINKNLLLYRGGEKSDKKIDMKDYLNEMSDSKFCLSFKGAGYCCFRYQEIPSVGSILVTPNYPLLIKNDYKDMYSCIKYNDVVEMKRKIKSVLESKDCLINMQQASRDNFLNNHTTLKRYQWFLEAIDMLFK